MKLLVAHDKSFKGFHFLSDLAQEEIQRYKVDEIICPESSEEYVTRIANELSLPLIVVRPGTRGELVDIYKEQNLVLAESCNRGLLLYDGKSPIMSTLLINLNSKLKKYRVIRYQDFAYEEIKEDSISGISSEETLKSFHNFYFGEEMGNLIWSTCKGIKSDANKRIVFYKESPSGDVVAMLQLKFKRESEYDSNAEAYINPSYMSGGMFNFLYQQSMKILSQGHSDDVIYLRCPKDSMLQRRVLGNNECSFVREETNSLSSFRIYKARFLKE